MSDLADIRRALADLQRSMGRVETGVANLGALEGRVRRLEVWRSWIAGAVAGVGAMVGYIIKSHN